MLRMRGMKAPRLTRQRLLDGWMWLVVRPTQSLIVAPLDDRVIAIRVPRADGQRGEDGFLHTTASLVPQPLDLVDEAARAAHVFLEVVRQNRCGLGVLAREQIQHRRQRALWQRL